MFNPRNWRIAVKPTGRAKRRAGKVTQLLSTAHGNLIDGHLRCQLAREGAQTIPLFTLCERGRGSVGLATLDPISAMAATDKKLDELFAGIQSEMRTSQDDGRNSG